MAQTTHPGRTSWILHSLEADRTRGLHYASLPYQTSHKTTTKNGIKLLYRRTLEPSPHTARANSRKETRNPSWRSCPLCAGVANPSPQHTGFPFAAAALSRSVVTRRCSEMPAADSCSTHPEALSPHTIFCGSACEFHSPTRGICAFVWMRSLFVYSLDFRRDFPFFRALRCFFEENERYNAVCPKVMFLTKELGKRLCLILREKLFHRKLCVLEPKF